MKICVVGCNGNMGTRYQAILRSLNHTAIGWDEFHDSLLKRNLIDEADAFIVATPTDQHLTDLYFIHKMTSRRMGWILCEKPIVKSLAELEKLKSFGDDFLGRLRCVNQYAYLPEMELAKDERGITSYNYFRTGKDGINWDCFQLYALANKDIVLDNKSPVWRSRINGVPIKIAHMDQAYVDMIKDFLGPQEKVWGWDKIEKTTLEIIRTENALRSNRSTSQKRLEKAPQ